MAGKNHACQHNTRDSRSEERTEGFSIAHLKELAVAVLCLDYPYGTVLQRLQKMLKKEKE